MSKSAHRCLKLSPKRHTNLLCQPPLEPHPPLAGQVKGQPSTDLFNGHPPVGFLSMVAPISQTSSASVKGHNLPPFSRALHKLLGRSNATPQVAPALHSVIRQCLQDKQVPPETINLYLGDLKSLSRYDNSWRAFWALSRAQGLNLFSCPMECLAGVLMSLQRISPPRLGVPMLLCS